jgi:hypothetical protein
MTDRRSPMPLTDLPMAEWLDRIVEALLIALLAFGPLALGVVHAWRAQVVIILAAAIVLVPATVALIHFGTARASLVHIFHISHEISPCFLSIALEGNIIVEAVDRR